MSILGWLVSRLTSGLLGAFGNSILKPVLDHLTAKDDVQRDIQVAQIGADRDKAAQLVQADIQANAAKAQIAPQFRGMIYAVGIPPAIHFGCYCLSAAFDLGWTVKPLPPEMVGVEQGILMAFFVSSPLTMLAKGITGRLGAK